MSISRRSCRWLYRQRSLWIYNPITLETLPLFQYTTATLPATALAMVLYLVLNWLLYVRRGDGAYGVPDMFAAAGRK